MNAGLLLKTLRWTVLSAAALRPAASVCAADAPFEADFRNPPPDSRPWVYWYWMNAAVSEPGILADLSAMRQAGLRGAYLMPIKGAGQPPLLQPPAEQLSPEFWALVRRAMTEADRLGLQLAMHDCDGFAVAGGPWITPELSMQKVVWSRTLVEGGRHFEGVLEQPASKEGYYGDIALLAWPARDYDSQAAPTARVSTDKADADPSALAVPGNKAMFTSERPCWIQFAYDQPFTCRSIVIRPGGFTVAGSIQGNRLLLEASDDGRAFHTVARLEPPRHGWQDGDADVTHAIAATTARFFRFRYDPEGSEPGSENLDSAKWRQSLKLREIDLSSEPRIHQFEGKEGEVWRVSRRTTAEQVPDSLCVPPAQIVDLTARMGADGRLAWDAPPGRWVLLRLGHTSTGHRNDTGGGGKGLECDKLSAPAAQLQFEHWFGEAEREAGPALAGRVLKVLHVDSWECGSQNWTGDFREEFARRRGYDPLRYLPAMAGIPVGSADLSERFLHDIRATIAELVVDRFFGTMARQAREHDCLFSAESVAPTMVSDGMLHFREVDLPMGEFWLRSPTHDKLNDILDAVSGSHTYGRQIAQSEALTELRIAWDEDPALFKGVADRNYCFGINRYVFHVFTENPWTDRRPGMTLNGVGSYFQRDQTWWHSVRAWVDYAARCQAVLQDGRPVADIAVFTGEEIPRRAVMPEQLVESVPGLVGEAIVDREHARLANVGLPTREMPAGVLAGANLSKPSDWVDPLGGYAYDSINADALLRLAEVKNGRIVLPGGASYAVLLFPGARPMSPDPEAMTPEVADRLLGLVRSGATVILCQAPSRSPSLSGFPESDARVGKIGRELWPGTGVRSIGRGRVVAGPWTETTLASLGVEPDFVERDLDVAPEPSNRRAIGWTHRAEAGGDLYFVSNQDAEARSIEVSLRASGRLPELWDPVSGEIRPAETWRVEEGRTVLPLRLPPSGSIMLVMRTPTSLKGGAGGANWVHPSFASALGGPWSLSFDPAFGGPREAVTLDALASWSASDAPAVRFYSGTAVYSRTFDWDGRAGPRARAWLELGRVANLAAVTLNGKDCGVAWTPPYRVDITLALRPGPNRLEIAVTNTWANRLIGDHGLAADQRRTSLVGPYRLDGQPLLEAGLLGPVEIQLE
jgi:hypothetical protein